MREGTRSIFKLNKELFLKNPWLYVSYGLMSALWCFAPFLLAYLVNLLLDDLSGGNFERYMIVLGIYTVLTYLNIYFARKSGIVEVKITSFVEQTLQVNMIRQVLEEKSTAQGEGGRMIDILENDFRAIELMLLVQTELLCNVVSLIGSLVIVLHINVYLTVFGFIPIVILTSVMGYLGESFRGKYASDRDSNMEFSSTVVEMVENHEVLQFIGDRGKILSNFEDKCRKRGENRIRKNMFLHLIDHSMSLANHLSVFLILLLAAAVLGKHVITVGALTLFINSINNGFSFLLLYNNVVNVLKSTEDSLERVRQWVKLSWKELPKYLTGKNASGCIREAEGDMPCRLVFTGFRMSDGDSVHEFEVKPGQILSISGGNSSGKSYFLRCIAGYQSYEGRISGICGDKEASRIKTGLLPQNACLFNAGIRENVTLFAAEEDPERALFGSNLLEQARNWDVNSDVPIGADGKSLSEGQRQRVAIARALHHGGNLLLLDDPFLFLDKENRKIILENIKKSRKTAVIVSNDENVIREADVRVVLKDRKIHSISYAGR